MDSTQQVILITGATDGLGRMLAEHLAAQGATLLLHGRNPAKGAAVVNEIRQATGNERLHYYNADFASLDAVRALAEQVLADQARLDVLVNNAGIGFGPPRGEGARRQVSQDGYELRFAVNYLAPFLLTHRLLPLLRQGAATRGEARIVNVASAGQQRLDFTDVMLDQIYNGVRAYRQSKLAQVMFTFDLAEKLSGSGITVNCLHPGSLMPTNMVFEAEYSPLDSLEQGLRATERLVVSEALRGVSGAYFDGERRARANEQAYDAAARRRLWQLSERWTGLGKGEAG